MGAFAPSQAFPSDSVCKRLATFGATSRSLAALERVLTGLGAAIGTVWRRIRGITPFETATEGLASPRVAIVFLAAVFQAGGSDVGRNSLAAILTGRAIRMIIATALRQAHGECIVRLRSTLFRSDVRGQASLENFVRLACALDATRWRVDALAAAQTVSFEVRSPLGAALRFATGGDAGDRAGLGCEGATVFAFQGRAFTPSEAEFEMGVGQAIAFCFFTAHAHAALAEHV